MLQFTRLEGRVSVGQARSNGACMPSNNFCAADFKGRLFQPILGKSMS
jgi:hypothetical protein